MDPREGSEGVLAELLGADAVLPEQFWNVQDGTTHLSGERGLMWAVFADGIDTYRRNAHGTSLRQRTEFKEAEGWVLSTDWDWPFSFVNLCETFGFNPCGVRDALEAFKSQRTNGRFRRQRFRPVTLHAA
jgi:hypothetical protein